MSCDLRVGWNRKKQTKSGLTKNWREFRPCRLHFFEAKRPHSTQRDREVHRKIGESSVSVNGVPAAQYTADEKAVKNGEQSIHDQIHRP